MRRCRPPLLKAGATAAVLAYGLTAWLCHAQTALGNSFRPDSTPLPTGVTGSGPAHATGGATGMGTIVRGVVGLAIVLAVIYGLHWLLKTTARGRRGQTTDAVEVLATTPLAQNRALHLVRAGDELLLVGSSESGVTPLRVYSAAEALERGLEVGRAAPALPPVPTPAEAPRLERGQQSRGVVGLLRAWTVRA